MEINKEKQMKRNQKKIWKADACDLDIADMLSVGFIKKCDRCMGEYNCRIGNTVSRRRKEQGILRHR